MLKCQFQGMVFNMFWTVTFHNAFISIKWIMHTLCIHLYVFSYFNHQKISDFHGSFSPRCSVQIRYSRVYVRDLIWRELRRLNVHLQMFTFCLCTRLVKFFVQTKLWLFRLGRWCVCNVTISSLMARSMVPKYYTIAAFR